MSGPGGAGGPGAEPVRRGDRGLEEALARYADGLFTYCLSVLCDQEQAVAAVASARELAFRHRRRLRRPELLRAWLYALARQSCLRVLEAGFATDALTAPPPAPAVERAARAAEPSRPEDGARSREPAGERAVAGGAAASAGAAPNARCAGRPAPGRHAGAAAPGGVVPPEVPAGPSPEDVSADRARGERRPAEPAGGGPLGTLALLAWPEAAGTTPEQREALELAGRHGLGTDEIAAVLGLGEQAAGALLAQAACEVERTSTALAVLAAGECPVLAGLGGGAAERRVGAGTALLGPALRGELVRHVDECPTCRGGAERAAADGPWPGTLRAARPLPLVTAPAAVRAGVLGPAFRAGAAAGRHRRAGGTAPPARRPGCGARARAGEPRFDRRGFPVHRPAAAERAAQLRHRALTTTVIAAVVAAPVVALWAAHRAGPPRTGPVSAVGSDSPAETATNGAAPLAAASSAGGTTSTSGGAALVAPYGAEAAEGGTAPRFPGAEEVAVEVGAFGGRTVITLWNTAARPLSWQAVSDAGWVRLSRDSGVLEPDARLTIVATVDASDAPVGPWAAHVVFRPSDEVVTITGGPRPGPASPSPTPGRRSGAPPTSTPPAQPGPQPTPAPTAPSSASASPSAPLTTSPSPAPSTTSPAPSTSPSPAPSGSATSTASTPAATASTAATTARRASPAHARVRGQ